MADEPLLLAVAQVMDVISFTQSHEVDEDFRAHSKVTMAALRPLQAEQRSHIDQMYGARPPSPDFLATQLLATYRGEAASVQLAKDAGGDLANAPTAVAAMSNAQCRAFKKEMKQRIHEWEAAVRDATGQSDVLPEQKAPLRSIYELYKASKNKVIGTESAARGQQSNRSSTAMSVEPSQPVSQSKRQSGGGEDGVAGAGGGRTSTVGQGGGGGSAASVGGSTTRLSTSSALRTSGASESAVRPSQGSAGGTAAAAGTTGAPGNGVAALSSSASAGGPASSSAYDRADVVSSKIPRISIGTTPVESMSTAELQAEKRRLKQVLHRFESDFAALYGEPPSRRDRRGFSVEYHRYGVLKTELSKREGSG